MSHHFDYTADERLDISDAYCFAGPNDAFGPRTVFGMNASPNAAGPWDPAGYYELRACLRTRSVVGRDVSGWSWV